jgi:phospholipid/cholesterol/gamma-HCH transport system permease protein
MAPRMTGFKSLYDAPARSLDDLGGQLAFYLKALAWTPRTIRRYKKEILRILAEVTLGSGSLAVIGGTVGVITAMCFFTGTEVGLQGYAALNQLGTSAFAGFVSAYFNTREIAPLVAGIALAATVGCGFTAQLGAMRISEEVDALEVMAIPSLPFLVTTRIIGGLIAIIPLYVVGLLSSYFATRLTVTQSIIPLYVVGLLSSYFATRLTVTQFFGQSEGTFDHYFNQFLPPGDVLWSFGKVLVFAVTVILIHCYYGYNASGGPAGVGVAVGRAVRTSIVAINVLDLFLSMAIWGTTTTVRLAG